MIAKDWSMRRTHVGRKNSRVGEFNLAEEFFRDETRKVSDAALWMQVKDTLRAFLTPDRFKGVVDRLRAATEDRLNEDKCDEVVTEIGKRFDLNDGQRKRVLHSMIKSGDFTRYGLMNGITDASKAEESYDECTRLERLGGAVVELPKHDWSKIAMLN